MILLIFVAINHLKGKAGKVFIAGLVFSTFGDFFLDYDGINWFIFGLGSFFIAHLCYLFALKPIEKKKLTLVALYGVYGIAMFSLIAGGLGELFIPVLAYMSILLIMAIVTLVSKRSNVWLVFGGLSFVFSDSLIGIDKFYQPIPFASILIMISYYFAQYALLKGFILSSKNRNI
ncbi:MAG: lysoplasmalogenase [Colwellia sp.]|nr:lysoplasmalogenase [Colwellia sp.]